MKVKKRLDVLLTEQGYAESRSKAQAIIMSGLVYVDGQKADKPGISYEESVSLEVRGAACPYVSRGGLKLEKALRDFGVKPEGFVCSDSGASTGGFTDCLLQQGASKVFAIDVGYGQLTEEEMAYYRRGKNAHVHAVPKSATAAEYAKATGLEALFGALYLAGKTQRLNELFRAVMEER